MPSLGLIYTPKMTLRNLQYWVNGSDGSALLKESHHVFRIVDDCSRQNWQASFFDFFERSFESIFGTFLHNFYAMGNYFRVCSSADKWLKSFAVRVVNTAYGYTFAQSTRLI